MATSEVCKVLIDTMRSPEIRNEPDGNVFIDPRQVKVALLCGVPRHRLGPLFVQRRHQWLKEADGASFRAALAASGDAVRPCISGDLIVSTSALQTSLVAISVDGRQTFLWRFHPRFWQAWEQ